MVYPYNNDLGKEKPENPSKDFASFYEAMNAEVLKIKTHYAAYTPSWVPTPKPTPKSWSQSKAMLDELIKYTYNFGVISKEEAYSQLYGKKPEPKLVDGMDFSAKYDPNPKPVPYTIKTGELRFEVKGLFEKTHGAQCYIAIPPEGLTETELREFLFKNFQQMTEKIISDVKKAKGIK